MVLPFIKPLKTSGIGSFTTGGKLLAWAAAATSLAYSTLTVNI